MQGQVNERVKAQAAALRACQKRKLTTLHRLQLETVHKRQLRTLPRLQLGTVHRLGTGPAGAGPGKELRGLAVPGRQEAGTRHGTGGIWRGAGRWCTSLARCAAQRCKPG